MDDQEGPLWRAGSMAALPTPPLSTQLKISLSGLPPCPHCEMGGRRPGLGAEPVDLSSGESSVTRMLEEVMCGGWAVHCLKPLSRGSLWELGSSPGLSWPATHPTGAGNVTRQGCVNHLLSLIGEGGVLASSGFTRGPNTGQTQSVAV